MSNITKTEKYKNLLKIDLDHIEPLKLYMKDELLLNPKYSLEPDPTGELGMKEDEKVFLKLLIKYGFTNFENFKDTLEMIAEDMDLTVGEVRAFWKKSDVKNEYDRITRAMRHRQYNQKQFDLTNIKSILTSMVLGTYETYNGKLSERERVDALKLLTNIILEESKIMTNASRMNAINVNVEEVKDLSITEIKALVAGIDENKAEKILEEKNIIINKMRLLNPSLQTNQIEFLYNLPIAELKEKLSHLESVGKTRLAVPEEVKPNNKYKINDDLFDRLKKSKQKNNNDTNNNIKDDTNVDNVESKTNDVEVN